MANNLPNKDMASELHTSSVNVKLAALPFNDSENADIILRSSDGIHFYVHKIILSIASSFFRDMFSLPQSDACARSTVDVTEDSATLDAILRLCYPVRDPEIKEWSAAVTILQAVTKYQMDEATELVTNHLKAYIPSAPLEVYGLACRPNIGTEILARLAAQEWMRQKSWASLFRMHSNTYSSPYYATVREWDSTTFGMSYNAQYVQSMTAGQWYRLLRCVYTWQLPKKFLVNENQEIDATKGKTLPIIDIFNRFSHGDIAIRSIDGHDIWTYRIILQLSSSKLLKSIEDGGQVQGFTPPVVTIYSLPEHSRTLLKVLEICDPSSTGNAFETADPDLIHNVLQMAVKYDIPKVVSAGKTWCTNLIKENPLRSYFIAICFGWEELTRWSARSTLFSSIENAYVPEMEHVSAKSYRNLMKYHHNFQREFSAVLNSCGPNTKPTSSEILFSIWRTADVENHSFGNSRWDEELAAIFSYATNISLRGSSYSDNDFKKSFESFTAELKTKLNAIKLEL